MLNFRKFVFHVDVQIADDFTDLAVKLMNYEVERLEACETICHKQKFPSKK